MAIELENISGINFDIDIQKIKYCIQKIVGDHKKIVNNIYIQIVTEEKLLGINKTFLNHDYHTDVITFDNSYLKKVSGEIFISYNFVAESAKKLNISFSSEFYRIVIHGLLHLCGYNDKTKAEKQKMTELEDLYLQEF